MNPAAHIHNDLFAVVLPVVVVLVVVAIAP